jgi:hypothetical protein
MPEVDQERCLYLLVTVWAELSAQMIAAENKVKGIAVYGAASRTWYEYLLDTLRYQGLVAGDNFENTDERVLALAREYWH